MPDLAAAASPITHVSAAAAPVLCVHGTRDDGVPPAQSELLVEAYHRAGAHAEMLVMPGAGHGFRGPQLEQATTASVDFLIRHLT